MAEDATMTDAGSGPPKASRGGLRASQHARAFESQATQSDSTRALALEHLQRLTTLFNRQATLNTIHIEATALLDAITTAMGAQATPSTPALPLPSAARTQRAKKTPANTHSKKANAPTDTVSATAIRAMIRDELRQALSNLSHAPTTTTVAPATVHSLPSSTPSVQQPMARRTAPNTGRHSTPSTYAAAAAASSTSARVVLPRPKKTKPTPDARKERQINLHGQRITANLNNISTEQLLTRINNYNGGGCIAVNIIQPSGDVRLAFHPNARQAFLDNTQWVEDIFGNAQALKMPTVTILVKGIPRDLEQAFSLAAQEISIANNVAIYRARGKNLGREKYTTGLLLELLHPEQANSLIDAGLLWRNGFYTCEPYFGEARPSLCYTCWSYGHTNKSCGKTQRCPHCAGRAHAPDNACPTTTGQKPLRCATCRGNHSARQTKNCPIAIKEWANAKALHRNRPKKFPIPPSSTPPSSLPPPSSAPNPPIPTAIPAATPDSRVISSQPSTPSSPVPSTIEELSTPQYSSLNPMALDTLPSEDNEGSNALGSAVAHPPLPSQRRTVNKPVGRPSGITRAARDPTQKRLSSFAARVSSTNPSVIASSAEVVNSQAIISSTPSGLNQPPSSHDH